MLSADNSSPPSVFAKVAVSLLCYVSLWKKYVLGCLAAFAWLVDERQYLMATVTSVAMLVGAALLLAFYEYMWRWQQHDCTSYLTGQQHHLRQQNQVHRNIVIEEDIEDIDWKEWARKGGRILLILFSWSVFLHLNTLAMFWIWSHYFYAQPHHNGELYFVNCLEASPILLGAAMVLYYLYPPFYSWHGQAAGSFDMAADTEVLQGLL
jgi:hypothetical protein